MSQDNPRPDAKPNVACFSSGPCAKRPGWTPDVLKNALFGRSHRSLAALGKLEELTQLMRKVLNIPKDYDAVIVTGSNTAAFEFGMWKLLGPRGVDVVAFESFGRVWKHDVVDELKLPDVRCFDAEDGKLPNLSQVDFGRDVVFVWVGTPTCVAVPGDDWIPDTHEGLVLCDAVSSLGVVPINWNKFDAVSFSWQKIFGGEATHGVCVLSPRARERMRTHKPSWPLPRLFRLRKPNPVWDAAFLGSPVNTISMLAVEDCIDAFRWADSIGGVPTLAARALANNNVLAQWVVKQDWIDFFVENPEHRAPTCTSLKFTEQGVTEDQKGEISKVMSRLLDKEGVAFDIKNHEDAPAGLRLWTGPTVEKADLEALLPWLEWAYKEAKCTLQS